VVEQHAGHPLAVYAQLAKGINCARDFKDLTPDKRLHVREAEPGDAVKLLAAVEQASAANDDAGVDNITLNMAMRRRARAEARAGSPARAAKVMDRMVSLFESKGLNAQVMLKVRLQAEATKAAIKNEASG
jgi:hypothetical protein